MGERLEVFLRAFDASGRELCVIGARSAESARGLLAELDAAEVVHLRGPGVPPRVWRDAVTRAWRSK